MDGDVNKHENTSEKNCTVHMERNQNKIKPEAFLLNGSYIIKWIKNELSN